MLFLDVSFDLLSQFLKRRSVFTTASSLFFFLLFFFFFFFFFFAFALVLFLFRIFLLNSAVIQGTEATDLLVLEGIYLSTAFCMKEVIKLKFS